MQGVAGRGARGAPAASLNPHQQHQRRPAAWHAPTTVATAAASAAAAAAAAPVGVVERRRRRAWCGCHAFEREPYRGGGNGNNAGPPPAGGAGGPPTQTYDPRAGYGAAAPARGPAPSSGGAARAPTAPVFPQQSPQPGGGPGGGGGNNGNNNDNNNNNNKDGSSAPLSSYARALVAAAFVTGLGAGVYFDAEVNLSPNQVASTEIIDRRTPNSEVCMAYGYSAMVFDQRVFVTYNPFNLYVSQPEVKPGCVLRRSNFGVLEREGLVTDKEAQACKRRMNTFGFVGDLFKGDGPDVSCVYHSEEAENSYLLGQQEGGKKGGGGSARKGGGGGEGGEGGGGGGGTGALAAAAARAAAAGGGGGGGN